MKSPIVKYRKKIFFSIKSKFKPRMVYNIENLEVLEERKS